MVLRIRGHTVPRGNSAMSEQTPVPANGGSPRRRLLRIGGIVLLLVVAGVAVALAASGGGRAGTAGGSAAPAGSTATAGAGDAAAPGSSASTGPGGIHINNKDVASAGTTALALPDIRPAPASARSAAETTLTADDAHYRQELATGEGLLGRAGFAAWAAGALQDSRNQGDFARAGADFTATDRPPALNTWHADSDTAAAAVQQFAKDGEGHGSTVATRTDAADAVAYLADADQVAAQVGSGK